MSAAGKDQITLSVDCKTGANALQFSVGRPVILEGLQIRS